MACALISRFAGRRGETVMSYAMVSEVADPDGRRRSPGQRDPCVVVGARRITWLRSWFEERLLGRQSAMGRGQLIRLAFVGGVPSQKSCRGATTLRGVRGLHSDNELDGDMILQPTRTVPAVTIVVDTRGISPNPSTWSINSRAGKHTERADYGRSR